MYVSCASFEKSLLHATAVFFESLVITASIAGRMQEIKSFKNIVCERVTALRFWKWLSRPALTALQPTVELPESSH